jgi:hypothetical protein
LNRSDLHEFNKKEKYGITQEEYKNKFPNYPIFSDNLLLIQKK